MIEVIEVFDCEQYSSEWWQCRLGIPTASAFAAVLAKGEGKTRRKYMMTLIGEQVTGEGYDSYSNEHMERGKEMEIEARDLYAFRTNWVHTPVGFIRRTDEWGAAGCSPDSLVGDDGLVEIKTKLPHIQAEVLLADKVPSEHIAQCQGELWVSGRKWVDFVSYWPKMPLFIKRLYRDEAYIERLAKEVALFNAELRTYLAHIKGLA